MRLLVLLLCCAILVPAPAAAQPINVEGLEIIEHGLFATKLERREQDPNSPTGFMNWVSDYRHLQTTTEFCARLNLSFGMVYRLTGATGRPITLDLVTRYPPAGMTNAAGKWFAQSAYSFPLVIGQDQLRTFTFEEPWEMVPGLWTFEFHYLGRKIGEQQFTVLPSCPVS